MIECILLAGTLFWHFEQTPDVNISALNNFIMPVETTTVEIKNNKKNTKITLRGINTSNWVTLSSSTFHMYDLLDICEDSINQ